MRRPLPYRSWRKVVAAAQGIVLTVAASGVLPGRASTLVVLVALAMLAESFGRDVRWLYRRRTEPLPGASRHALGAAVPSATGETT
jgi:hypothetical protein